MRYEVPLARSTWSIVAPTMIAWIAAVMFAPRPMRCCCGESKADVARATGEKFAFEAYPSWALAHPERACPDGLEDLNEYMNNRDIRDPWGHDFVMRCGRDLPAGARGIAILSAGEDGELGTCDDIESWDKDWRCR